MAITRLRQVGFETRAEATEFDSITDSFLVINSTSPKSGSYALNILSDNGNDRMGWTGLSSSQARAAFHWICAGARAGSPQLHAFSNGATWVASLRYGLSSSTLTAYIGTGSVQAGSTILPAGTSYRHLGIDLKIAASGWFATYIDGALEIYWSGNTASTASSFTVYDLFSGCLGSHSWKGGQYFDDCYLDDTSGATSASVVPDRRFLPYSPCAVGASAQWTASPAASNFQNVDDFLSGSHDGLTTYISSSVLNQVDLYDFQNPAANAISASDAIIGVIVCAVAQKSDAAASTQLNLVARGQSGSVAYGSDQNLPSSFGWLWSRFTTDPDTGTAWAGSTAIANAQFGIRSRGI